LVAGEGAVYTCFADVCVSFVRGNR
jgi:hypothetical protein